MKTTAYTDGSGEELIDEIADLHREIDTLWRAVDRLGAKLDLTLQRVADLSVNARPDRPVYYGAVCLRCGRAVPGDGDALCLSCAEDDASRTVLEVVP